MQTPHESSASTGVKETMEDFSAAEKTQETSSERETLEAEIPSDDAKKTKETVENEEKREGESEDHSGTEDLRKEANKSQTDEKSPESILRSNETSKGDEESKEATKNLENIRENVSPDEIRADEGKTRYLVEEIETTKDGIADKHETMDVEEEEEMENGQEDDDDEVVETEEGCQDDQPEVGIVGPPTAVRDIVNDEELGTTESSSLPSDNRNEGTTSSRRPDVADWIERSRRTTNDTNLNRDKSIAKKSKKRKKSAKEVGSGIGPTRKSQRIVTNIIRRSIKCLNKMHAAVEYGSAGSLAKKSESADKREEDCSRASPKVPQSRQNGAALPEETATAMATSGTTVSSERLGANVKSENHSDVETEGPSIPTDCSRPRRRSIDENRSESRNSSKKQAANPTTRHMKNENSRKRRSTEDPLGGSQIAKKICFEQRERFIESLVGTNERISANELASRADVLRAEVQALDELARAKELEWNEILSMRKLKEEAYLRIERRRQVVGYMESNGRITENLPPASLSLNPDWAPPVGGESAVGNASRLAASCHESISSREMKESEQQERLTENSDCQRVEDYRQASPVHNTRREKSSNAALKSANQRSTASPKETGENGRKTTSQPQQQQQQQQQQRIRQSQNSETLDNRQIGEGRQGPIVDVRSIIADYRLRHPESVPRRYEKKESSTRARESTSTTTTSGLINVRRGRRMRNSVNVGLGAGGAMLDTTHGVESRSSSTDSCKSNQTTDPNMSFKDVLVQFAKLSQQQNEPVKTPQNYPDVTLHPVAPTQVTVNHATTPQQSSGSLLHGILTKSHSPRPTTFSPTLARLLTAPERDRNSATASIISTPQQTTQTQHLLQAYQGSNPVSISDLLSSSKARTEITITPVVTPVTPSHSSQSNSLVHVEDVDEDSSLLDDRDSRLGSGGRDGRDERDNPPRCQGCQERAAQFVCAGCGNQWYCSRDCQVAAWDEHSEVCSG